MGPHFEPIEEIGVARISRHLLKSNQWSLSVFARTLANQSS